MALRLIAIGLLDELLQEGRDAGNGIDEDEFHDANNSGGDRRCMEPITEDKPKKVERKE
jgi:hypothetical protein